ncbi:hypothetical protein KFE25_013681 [Diacronema lutheri]|uniref:RRM domain-containing protein n=1 Tax=Diacronema lutheri TaxID=2081491 RepID=A0A8J5XNR8_DIALT|nr:hypothetical protein KFE25_013681 [Diacronema lutheri]
METSTGGVPTGPPPGPLSPPAPPPPLRPDPPAALLPPFSAPLPLPPPPGLETSAGAPPPFAPPPPWPPAALAPALAWPHAPALALPPPPPLPPFSTPPFGPPYAAPPGQSVLDRVLAADNARKRAADERNAAYVASALARGGAGAYDASAVQACAAELEPTPPELGAEMLRRASKQRRVPAGAYAAARRAPPTGAPPSGIVPTSVYAAGIPPEATQDEVERFFSKVGPISRAKLYVGSNGAPKGDALVTYRTAGGAEAALRLLHGRHVRPGPGAVPVSLSLASFERKDERAPGSDLAGEAAADAPQPPPPPQPQRMPTPPPPPPPRPTATEMASLAARTIVVRHVFTATDVAAAPSADALAESIKDELWIECCKCGEVEQILAHVRGAPLGSATVRFEGALAAAEAVDLLDGRFYCERRLDASFWDGDAQYACGLDVDVSRQLQFGFGDAAAQAAAAAAATPSAGARAAQGRPGDDASGGAVGANGGGSGRAADGGGAAALDVASAADEQARAAELSKFMAEVGGL